MACQEDDSDGDVELEDEEAEYDSMLIENAGEVIPVVAKVVGGKAFVPYFQEFLPDLLKKLKPGSSIAEKSFAIGTIGETLHAMEDSCAVFAENLYPYFLSMIQDEDEEVRSNTIFGLGVLAFYGGSVMHIKYPEILKLLFNIVSQEKDKRVIDNIIAAVCRMIISHTDGVPLNEVLPVVIQCLPLKEDMEENITVYNCIAQLYAAENPIVIQHLPHILTAIADTLGEKELQSDVVVVLREIVQNVSQKYPESLQNVLGSISEEQITRLRSCCINNNGS